MSNGVDLAAAAVDAVTRAGAAAATAAGSAAGGMAVELVRGRLSGISQGPEAVAAVEQAPEDPDARTRLREKLAEVLAEDPAFAAYLASLLAPPRPTEPPTTTTITGSINIDRNARTRGNLVLGDQAITKIRKGDPMALLSLVAVVVVLALAIYGLAGLTGGGNDEGPLSAGGSGHKVTALKDPELVKAVTPDLHSMPSGWTSESEPAVRACDRSGDKCKGVLSMAQSSFHDQYDQSARFGVVACATAADAERVYREMAAQETSGKPLSVPALGQESSAVEVSGGEGQAYARVGTVVVYTSEQGSNDDYHVETLESLARMIAARAQEAQDGQAPSARAL
ncbi:hypothetical protein [Streptomyces sp. NPDC093225]|uniref:hypothetical protein n=1 Tax=Streptomyces sp. NPDC093225 TaxID=3366034 RepID=UPI00382EE47B